MVIYCYPKKRYYVATGVWRNTRGGFRNFLATSNFQRALSVYRRSKVKTRQIDVRGRGIKPYALMWERM